MDWTELLRDLLYTIITAAVPIITVYLIKFLKAKFTKLHEDTKNSIVENTLYEITDLIEKAVASTSQTYVDSLKASGTFTKESQIEAFNKTKETVLALMSEESKDILEAMYGDLSTWLTVQIENSVRTNKSSK